MVQAFFSRILSRRGNHRAVFYLGAAASTAHRRRVADFSSTRDRNHRQLLLLQSANHCAVFAVNRRRVNRAEICDSQRPPRQSAIAQERREWLYEYPAT